MNVEPYRAGPNDFGKIIPGGEVNVAEQEILSKEIQVCKCEAQNDSRIVVKCVEKYGENTIKTLRIYGSNIDEFKLKKEIVTESSKAMHNSFHKVHILQRDSVIFYFKRVLPGGGDDLQKME